MLWIDTCRVVWFIAGALDLTVAGTISYFQSPWFDSSMNDIHEFTLEIGALKNHNAYRSIEIIRVCSAGDLIVQIL